MSHNAVSVAYGCVCVCESTDDMSRISKEANAQMHSSLVKNSFSMLRVSHVIVCLCHASPFVRSHTHIHT